MAALLGALTADRSAGRLGVGPDPRLGAAPRTGTAHPARAGDSPIPFLLAAGMIIGFVIVVYNINQVSFRQAITPERLRAA